MNRSIRWSVYETFNDATEINFAFIRLIMNAADCGTVREIQMILKFRFDRCMETFSCCFKWFCYDGSWCNRFVSKYCPNCFHSKCMESIWITLKLTWRFDEPFDIRSHNNGSPRNISSVALQLGCDKYYNAGEILSLLTHWKMLFGYGIPSRIKTFARWPSHQLFRIASPSLSRARAQIFIPLPPAIKNPWLIFDIYRKLISHYPWRSFVKSYVGHTLVLTDSKLQNQRIDFNLSGSTEKISPLKISSKPRPKFHNYVTQNYHQHQPNIISYDQYMENILNPFGPYRGSISRWKYVYTLFSANNIIGWYVQRSWWNRGYG